MKKYINIKRVYLFTFISLLVTFLFLYIFAETAPYFYTGFDEHTSKNTISKIADYIFKILLSVDFIGIVLCIIYPVKILFNKLGKFFNKTSDKVIDKQGLLNLSMMILFNVYLVDLCSS